MELYVLRHGETDLTKEKRCAGWSDIALNEAGRIQAKEIAAHIPLPLVAIFSSTLPRAMETASIIATERHFPLDRISPDKNLMERNFGKLTKMTWDEIAAFVGNDLKPADRNLSYDYITHGGETAVGVEKRVKEFLDLPELKREGNKLVVTHGGIIRILKLRFPFKVLWGADEANGEPMKPCTLYQFTV
ncbi:MAG: histidine phosphatase family protein [Candidatus Jorgensenbacteria bacterium]|nr:histidine phosphatase family protein [Candidatus Jorgensenbacteria bacterium]